MKLIDVINQVKEDGNIDDRELICYSQSSITYTKFYVLFTRYITINQPSLPNKMIMSIKDDILHIYKATNKGEIQEYYASIKIENLKYIETKKRDFVNDVHKFILIQDEGEPQEFYIICNKEREAGRKLVEAIIKYFE